MSTDTNETPDVADTPSVTTQTPGAPVEARDILRRWWSVLSKPGIATFDSMQDGASWQSIAIQTLLVGLVGAVLGAVFIHTNLLAVVLLNVVGAYLGLLAIAGLTFASARLFGGTGKVLPHVYALTLVYVPLQLLGAILGILPYVGQYVLLALLLYQILLSAYATASVHRLTLLRAGLAVLITFALLLLIGFIP